MSSRLAELAARREALVARSTLQRARLELQVHSLRGEIALVEIALGTVKRLRRSGLPLALGALALFVVGPSRVTRGLSLVVRLAPFAIDAYRLARFGRERFGSTGHDSSMA